MGRRLLAAAALAAGLLGTGGAALAPAPAQAEVEWLCKPGTAPDPCREPLTTTVQEPGGASRVEDPAVPDDPPIDCFYVYPTVSQQQGVNADKAKDPEVVAIARYQAQRYSTQCRVFAPVYRQLTLLSIFGSSAGQRAEGFRIAYGDVLEAWREYLAKHNEGRGVVLIGHSQGTRMLRKVLREEVDPKPDVRRRLVSGLLLGGNVLVRKGQQAGGDAQDVPACTQPGQIRCLVAFSAFLDDPPSGARFGRPPAVDETNAGFPAGPQYEVLCTNPASLGANARRELTSLVRTESFPGIIGAGLVVTYGGLPPTAPTPWLQPGERYTGRCETIAGANVLKLHAQPGARRLNPFPEPGWGVHLVDGNIALGELVDVVRRQREAYVRETAPAARPTLRLRCRRGVLRVAVTGAAVRRVEVRRGARVLARDRRAPFRVRVPRLGIKRAGVTRLRVVAVLADGTRVVRARSVRRCR